MELPAHRYSHRHEEMRKLVGDRHLGMRRDKAHARLAAASDQDLLARGGAFHVPTKVVAELVGADLVIHQPRVVSSGARGTRTPDLSAASRTLSQLSYSPR